MQDRVSNGDSVKIQSVLCGDTLREKKTIVVRRSPLERSSEQLFLHAKVE